MTNEFMIVSPISDYFEQACDLIHSDKYPENAQANFEILRNAGEEALAAKEAARERNQRNIAQISALEVEIKIMERDAQDSRIVPESHTRQLERKRKQLAELKEARRAFHAPAPALTGRDALLKRLRDELNGGMDLATWVGTRSNRRSFNDRRCEVEGDVETALDAALVTEQKLLERALSENEAAPSVEDAIARAKEIIRMRANKARPRLDGVLRVGRRGVLGDIQFPDDTNAADWLFAGEIAAKVETEIRAAFKGKPQIPLSARKTIREKLEAEWLDNQRTIVRACVELGKPIPVVHPLAALEIEYGELADDNGEKYAGRDADRNAAPTLGLPQSKIQQITSEGTNE